MTFHKTCNFNYSELQCWSRGTAEQAECFFLTSSPKLRGKIPSSQRNFKNGDGKWAGRLFLGPLRQPCPRSPPASSRVPSSGPEHGGRRRLWERIPRAAPARDRPRPPELIPRAAPARDGPRLRAATPAGCRGRRAAQAPPGPRRGRPRCSVAARAVAQAAAPLARDGGAGAEGRGQRPQPGRRPARRATAGQV